MPSVAFDDKREENLKEKLAAMDENKFTMVSTVELKDPTTILLVSIFLGGLGIDRFMLGDTGMGILKLLTGGCCGILTIIDWFTVSKKTKELNFNNIMTVLYKNISPPLQGRAFFTLLFRCARLICF